MVNDVDVQKSLDSETFLPFSQRQFYCSWQPQRYIPQTIEVYAIIKLVPLWYD